MITEEVDGYVKRLLFGKFKMIEAVATISILPLQQIHFMSIQKWRPDNHIESSSEQALK